MTQPWGLLAIQIGIFGAAAFTKPTSSVRYVAIAVMAAIAYYFHSIVHKRMDNRLWKAFLSGLVVSLVLNAVERLLISRWSYEASGPEEYRERNEVNVSAMTKNSPSQSLQRQAESRFWFVLDMVLSLRGVGKPWQVKNIPHFSSTHPSWVPSRTCFLFREVVVILFCYVIQDFATAQPPPEARLVAASKEPFLGRLGEISAEESVFRIACTIGYWIGGAVVLNLAYHTSAFVAVASGISKPAAWPSSFGWLTEAYSIRQFWGAFWHQNFRATFEGISHLLVNSVLGIPKGTVIARYSNIYFAFFLSGFIHRFWIHMGDLVPGMVNAGVDLSTNSVVKE
ncbi:MAG: hypothetical protein Q9191_005640 [Dirinaria sp. TL-2023a]